MDNEETVEDIISKYANIVPTQLLSIKPDSTSTSVRSFLFSLENLISQLNSRIPELTEKYYVSCVYKYNGPQRHQQFWRYFKQLKSLVCKYNNRNFLKVVNDLHKKMSISIAQSYYYMPRNETLKYIAATTLEQLYVLQKLKEKCTKVADVVLGYIDIDHWVKLGLFILGLCADIFQLIPSQTATVCSAYDSLVEFVVRSSSIFPAKATALPFVHNLLKVEESNGDPERVYKLLRMSQEKMEEAVFQHEIKLSKSMAHKTLNSYLESTKDFGVTIKREKTFEIESSSLVVESSINTSTPKKKKLKRKSIADVSIATASEEAPTQYTGTKKKKRKRSQEELLSKDSNETVLSASKIKKKKKPKVPEPIASSTPIVTKEKKRVLDLSLSSIGSSLTNKKKKAHKRKNKEVSLANSVDSSVLKKKRKKKKSVSNSWLQPPSSYQMNKRGKTQACPRV